MFAVCLAVVGASAQEVATGVITGRVLNATNGKYLPSARVIVEGTNLEAITNDYGDFSLRNVPAGEVMVRAIFPGQAPQAVSVTVNPGQTAQCNITLGAPKAVTDGMIVLDEFRIETERYKNAQQIAIAEERYSPTIKNVIDAGAFGDIPDGNVGEFVKYVPGVQIDYGYSGTGIGNAADNNATSVSVRGFGPEFTAITLDGVPLTNASPASLTRAVGLDMMSINNASRVEVVKVPTPDMPADSPGGSINLVTRSAFEYAKPAFNFSVSMSVNSESDFEDIYKKTPGPASKSIYKSMPGGSFSYVHPINEKMGLTLSGAWSRTFNENHNAKLDHFYVTRDINTSPSYRVDLRPGGGPLVDAKGKGDTAVYQSYDGDELDLSNPLLWRYQVVDSPNLVERSSGSLKFDWRPTASQHITVGYTMGLTDTVDAARRLQFYADKSYYMDWGPDFTTSYKYIPKGTVINGTPLASNFDPKATVHQELATRDREGATHTGYVKYEFKRGPWVIDANVNASRSRGAYKDIENGHFSGIETSISGGQIMFKNISDGIPGAIEFYDRDGNPLDWTNLSNWKAPEIKAKSGNAESLDQRTNLQFNVRRDLDFIPWDWITVSAKAGYYRMEQEQKKWGTGTGYQMTYYGPDLSFTDYLDDAYDGISPGFGVPGQQWVSTYKLYDLWQQNPSYFNPDSDTDKGTNWQSYVNQQKSITETSDEYYFMLDGKTLKNRLHWVAGVRQTIASRKGYAAKQISNWQYVKNTDGSIYRDDANPNGVKFDSAGSPLFKTDAAGETLRANLDSQGIWYPDHVITSKSDGGTFYEYSQLRYQPFDPIDGKITGKPNYSASMLYNLTDNIDVRVSWNRSQARPDFENGTLTADGASRTEISENSDPDASPRGTITIGNPELKPWVADSWNLQLNYYTPSGGKFGVNPFYTETRNFHETLTFLPGDAEYDEVLRELGLDPSFYDDWAIKTTINGIGTAKTTGCEFEARQNFGFLGPWGKHFDVYASFSTQSVKQQSTTKLSAKPLSKNTASGGLSFATKRFSVLLRALWLEEKYNGETEKYQQANPDERWILASYYPSEIKLDLNMRYKLSEHYSLFVDARNILNESRDTLAYDPTGLVPSYAHLVERKEFGVTWYFGVNGSF